MSCERSDSTHSTSAAEEGLFRGVGEQSKGKQSSGKCEWKERVERASGKGEWKGLVERASGNGEWKVRVERVSGRV